MFQMEKSKNEAMDSTSSADNMSTTAGTSGAGTSGAGSAIVAEGYNGKSVDETLGGKYPAFTPVHFIETRKYLQQVRDGKRSIELLENRIKYRENAGLPTGYLQEELENAKYNLNVTIAEVAEEISKLHDVGQEMVLTRRYIDGMTWDQVAASLDMKMRTVQKLHGHALPELEWVLLDDGRIEIEGEANGAAV